MKIRKIWWNAVNEEQDLDEALCAHVCDRHSTAFTLIGLLECVQEEMVNG